MTLCPWARHSTLLASGEMSLYLLWVALDKNVCLMTKKTKTIETKTRGDFEMDSQSLVELVFIPTVRIFVCMCCRLSVCFILCVRVCIVNPYKKIIFASAWFLRLAREKGHNALPEQMCKIRVASRSITLKDSQQHFKQRPQQRKPSGNVRQCCE